MVHTIDLRKIIRQSMYNILNHYKGMGYLETHSPTLYNGQLREYSWSYTLDKIYLTGILQVQCLQISLQNVGNVPKNEHDLQFKTYPTTCTHHKLHNDNESNAPECNKWQNVKKIIKIFWGTQPRIDMITMGLVDTSDLIMIITRAMDIYFQSPKLK